MLLEANFLLPNDTYLSFFEFNIKINMWVIAYLNLLQSSLFNLLKQGCIDLLIFNMYSATIK